MTKDTALRLALEALESGEKMQNGRLVWIEHDTSLVKQAITAIKAALEAKDEPLAYLKPTASPDNACYTPPQRTWVRLTDEDISEIVRGTHNTGSFVRAIEAKLKDKNT